MTGELKYWKDGEVTTYDLPTVLIMMLYPQKSGVAENATNKLFAKCLDNAGNPIMGLTITGVLTKPDASTENLSYTYAAGVYEADVISSWTDQLGTYSFTSQALFGGTTYSATNNFEVVLTVSDLYDFLKKHDRKTEGLIMSLPPSP